MTTTDRKTPDSATPSGPAVTGASARTGSTAVPTARRRPRQAPAGRALATGAALTATGLLVAFMGAQAGSTSTVAAVTAPQSLAAAAPPVATSTPPPTTIVIIHRPAAGGVAAPVAVAPSAGRAVPATRPSQPRASKPAATSSAS